MVKSYYRSAGRWKNTGGIISLAKFAEEHDEALNYDLLTRTHYQLNDVGGRLSWSALSSFIHNLKSDSAVARELGYETGWENTIKTNEILADIYDVLMAILVAVTHSKKKPKPYPRPGKDKDKKRIGKGAIPYNQLREWIKERQKHG